MKTTEGLEPRVSLITLGVSDLERSTKFYRDVLGWTPSSVGGDAVRFFDLNGTVLGLFPLEDLADDVGMDSISEQSFSRVALAHNVRTRDEVDRALDRVRDMGGHVLKEAEDASWGGRSGYFSDPDGFLWEVAWNPHFPIRDDGSIELPE